jgi:hypothetical protein
MSRQHWDDDRLAAAFNDRFDRPAPRELLTITLERVRTTARRPRWWPTIDRSGWLRLASAGAAVALVVVLLQPGAGTTPVATPPPPAASTPLDTGGQATPHESLEPTPIVAGFPVEIAGLHVLSVPEALAAFDSPTFGDTELAVIGWYTSRFDARFCPFVLPGDTPLIDRCGEFRAWLRSVAEGGDPSNPTSLPAIQPRFLSPVEPPRNEAAGTDAGSLTIDTPRPLILIGHIHDDRATRCSAPERSACDATFVVDQVASEAGPEDPFAATSPVMPTRLTAVQALEIAREAVDGTGTVLTLGLEHGLDAPWFSSVVVDGVPAPATWFVRGYRALPAGTTDPRGAGTPVAGWLAIDDSTGKVTGALDASNPNRPSAGFTYASPPDGFPASIEGLPVRNLFDIVRPDRPSMPPGAPIAVAGWFSQLPLHPCPSAVADCNRETVVLAATDRQLVTYGSGGVAMISQPNGPVIHPVTLPGGPPPPAGGAGGSPRRAVFIVHQGDGRANAKRPGDAVDAQDFILDQVAWLDGKEQPPAVWIQGGIQPARSPGDPVTIPGPRTHGPWWIISTAAVQAHDLPSIGGPSGSGGTRIVWMLRATGSNPGGSTGTGFGWGLIIVDDASGTVTIDWTDGGP